MHPPRAAARRGPTTSSGHAVAVAVASLLLVGLSVPGAAAGDRERGVTLRVTPAQAAAPHWHPDGVSDDAADGLVHTGLDDTGDCPGGFEVEAPAGQTGHAHCSHGPDRAPAGVDVTHRPTLAELHAREADAAEDGPAMAAGGQVPCYGDGTSDRRVQAVYAVSSDRTDRFTSVADLIRGYAATADQAFASSAARDGGVRHLRWVTGIDCTLTIAHVVMSPTGDDSISATRAELAALGLNRTDRKYIVWADATTYCGIAYVAGDSRADATNPANNGPTYARIDSGCWGGTASVAAHEIAHTLGAVSLSAPHSNGAWHCTDEFDRLCYDDGSGATLTYLCASSQEPLLDCNGDDYFNVAPAAGSWLSTHWNLASSAFLATVEPDAWSSPPPATPPPTTTTSAAPAPTAAAPIPLPPATTTPTSTSSPASTGNPRRWVVTKWSATLTSAHPVRRLRLHALAGELRARVRIHAATGATGATRVRVTVRDGAGRVLTSRRLRSGAVLSRTVREGTYRLVVSGSRGTQVTLRVGRYLSS